jgi:PAS domain S-box-containing protein
MFMVTKNTKPGRQKEPSERSDEPVNGASSGAVKRRATDAEVGELRERLQEAEATLNAIRSGEVDALVVTGPLGDRVYTLKGAEHPYRVFVERMSEGAVTLTPEGTILYCNGCFSDLLETRLELVIGRSIYDYLDPEERERGEALLEQGLTGTAKEEFALRTARGDSVPVYLSVSSLEIEEARTICMVATDLSEQKRNERALAEGKRRLDEELLKANKLESIGILAGGLAHDLNNSLAAILGNISLAKRSLSRGSEQFRKLSEAEAACLQARDVTQQLLTFSKGGVPVRRPAPVGQLLLDWAGFALSGSNVQGEFDIAEDLWTADIDEGQISRVINNLIINAQQAMPQGGTVTVRAENVTVGEDRLAQGLPLLEGKYVKIEIQDRGTGIPPAHLHRIFDPYFTTKQKGSGLGLSIAYSVTRSHEGYITVESQLGVGTTFYIYLPSSGVEAPATERKAESHDAGGLKVLVMEDQEAIRDLIANILSEVEEDQVEFAGEGAEALELYRRAMEQGQPFDVVMMDLTIPGGMGGKEAIARLLEIDPGAKAIVFSGYSNDPIMADFHKYGFSGVVRKPFQVDELLEVLHAVGNPQRETP